MFVLNVFRSPLCLYNLLVMCVLLVNTNVKYNLQKSIFFSSKLKPAVTHGGSHLSPTTTDSQSNHPIQSCDSAFMVLTAVQQKLFLLEISIMDITFCIASRGAFTNLVTCWPGSTHDITMLCYSAIQPILDSSQLGKYYILANSGYTCQCNLLVPYSIKTTDPKEV